VGLWDELAPVARDSGALDGIEDLLRSIDVTATVTDVTEPRLAKRLTLTWSPGGGEVVRLDPTSGRFTTDPDQRADGDPSRTPLEFPEPVFTVRLDLDLPAADQDPHGPFTLDLTVPRAVVRLPMLRGAKLDATGMLVADPAEPDVRFTLPRIVIRVRWEGEGSGLDVDLVSAATAAPTGPPAADPADLYEFVRMEPAHALVGPGDVVGFAFRTAVLDLSGDTTPPGSPALGAPGEWKGLWLPEARLFVAPNGLEGFAVSGGVRDLWIGFGEHAGVTGLFELEMVNRGSDPVVRVRFQDAAGRWYAGDAADVQLPERTTVYVDANGYAPVTFEVQVGSTTVTSDRAEVVTPTSGSVTVVATATDGQGRTGTRTIAATRRAAPPLPAPGSGPQEVRVDPGSAAGSTASRIVVTAQTATHATLRLEPPGGDVDWSWPGGGSAAGATATVPVASGADPTTLTVTATRTRAGGSPSTLDCFFLIAKPAVSDDATGYAYSSNPGNTRTVPALTDGQGFPAGDPFIGDTVRARLADLPAGTTVEVDGFASFDGSRNDPVRNLGLSQRRRDALVHLLTTATPVPAGVTVTAGDAAGNAVHEGAGGPRNRFWRATARITPPTDVTETLSVTLRRDAETPAEPPIEQLDPTPSRPPVPDWFRKLGARVELIRGTFVRAELYGEIDIQTAAEDQLSASGTGTIPARTNPNDGISRFLVRLRIAEDRATWDVTAEFRAIEADADGLFQLTRPTSGSAAGVDVVGALAILAPLLATATPPSPNAGELVALTIATGAVAAIGAAGVIETQKLTLRGAELVVADGPDGTSVTVMLDVETAFSANLLLIEIPADRPVTTRYQAVGVRSRWDTPAAGDVEYLPTWAFDPSRGYSLDVPAGALVGREPLGDLLRAQGFRISRDNPTYLEVEVGIGADLGIVSVDTVRVRVRLDEAEVPQITAFGASVDVPGTLRGSGYLSLPPGGGVSGAIDISLEPLNIRVAGALKIQPKDGVTGVFLGLEVEFPVPILLGQSGLGIFGVLGGVGVNMRRDEPVGVPVPALRWLETQMARDLGVLDPRGWEAEPDAYAFAAGILLGTVEGGFVVHLKGIIILELPGPRLLLVMKADVLKMPPALRGDATATFLAVLDLDFARGTVTIGIVAEYDVAELIHVRVPVTAFFDTNQPQEWFVELGNYTERVTVSVFEVFQGSGYLMVHGNGIDHPRFPGVVTSGLTIATGFHLQFVWGSTSVGLYLKVAGGFDAIVSFVPFALGGIIELSGELRLFIVSIGASAKLTVLAGRGVVGGVEVERTWIHGEVCGKVDFFFFSVKGCVSFELGDDGVPDPEPPPLVAGVSLVSRSPALVEGSGTDRPIDGALGEAREVGPGGAPLDPDAVDPDAVPLDVVPVVLFDVPATHPGLAFRGAAPTGHSGVAANPWIRRGRHWWRYEVTSVDLVGDLTDGPTPATWWSRGNPADPQHGPALALLSWVPDAHPRAVPVGEVLRETVTRRWGTVCAPAADPAPVLWTFLGQPHGPNPAGWRLDGVAWPDADDTFRSTTTRSVLHVSEPWRCGDDVADRARGIDPARVVGDAVPCRTGQRSDVTAVLTHRGKAVAPSRDAGPGTLADLAAVAAKASPGTSPATLRAVFVDDAWDPEDAVAHFDCTGELLRSPHGDGPEPVPGGDPDDEKLVVTAWEQRKFRPHDLLDVVRLEHHDGLRALAVLLLVPERLTDGQLVLRFADADGTPVGEQRVGPGDRLGSGASVPARWLDPDGPWVDEVLRVAHMAARVASLPTAWGRPVPCLVHLDVPDEASVVDIGWDPKRYPPEMVIKVGAVPPFHVAAAEGLGVAEVRRSEYDETTVERDREALTSALEHEPDDHALLRPGEDYQVRVSWRAASIEADAQPSATATFTWGDEHTQVFGFGTEPASAAPARLDPWVLTTAPAADEGGIFCDEPVRVVFAHGAVDRLFAAYGTELRLRVRSASGRHPKAAGQDEALPIVIDLAALLAPQVSVLTPWEETVRDLSSTLPCIPTAGERVDHRVLSTRFAFEPCTDHLLDVIRVETGAPPDAEGTVVMRAGFTTSRFADVQELAHLVGQAVLEHRYLADRAPLDALVPAPTGEVLDAALTAAGLGVPEVPRYPRVEVLWTGDAVPQPVAVIVGSNEPLWRSRPVPVRHTVPPGAAEPERAWWALSDEPWLRLAASSAPPGSGDLPRASVERIVRGPGGTRAVVLLAGGSRGRELRLSLVRPADPVLGTPEEAVEALQVRLLAAPWEEEH
jgi:large repetitive protein